MLGQRRRFQVGQLDGGERGVALRAQDLGEEVVVPVVGVQDQQDRPPGASGRDVPCGHREGPLHGIEHPGDRDHRRVLPRRQRLDGLELRRPSRRVDVHGGGNVAPAPVTQDEPELVDLVRHRVGEDHVDPRRRRHVPRPRRREVGDHLHRGLAGRPPCLPRHDRDCEQAQHRDPDGPSGPPARRRARRVPRPTGPWSRRRPARCGHRRALPAGSGRAKQERRAAQHPQHRTLHQRHAQVAAVRAGAGSRRAPSATAPGHRRRRRPPPRAARPAARARPGPSSAASRPTRPVAPEQVHPREVVALAVEPLAEPARQADQARAPPGRRGAAGRRTRPRGRRPGRRGGRGQARPLPAQGEQGRRFGLLIEMGFTRPPGRRVRSDGAGAGERGSRGDGNPPRDVPGRAGRGSRRRTARRAP